MPTPYEIEREANIKRNRALLEELDLKQAVSDLGFSTKTKSTSTAKPVQPAKRVKREVPTDVGPRRQSARLRSTAIDPNESPETKRKRVKEEEESKAREAEERLEAEERAREAKRPRHHDLNLKTLVQDLEEHELGRLNETLQTICRKSQPRGTGDYDSFVYNNDQGDKAQVKELKERLSGLKVVARAKVTQDRIYSAAYHPEVTKDLIFFGDKHGQLGIWDAQAPVEEVVDEDGEILQQEDGSESGKYWRLQHHWPATSKSSISAIKFDPIDSHTVYTSSYDCTIRSLSLGTGVSKEIFSLDDTIICSIDLSPHGHDMWISDGAGGITHYDLRQDKKKAKWYGLSNQKIGSISVNPTKPHYLLTASNSRALRIWDTRKLETVCDVPSLASDALEISYDTIETFHQSDEGRGSLRSEWMHDKSVSSAYWDPRGRSVVSTSYDDTIRLWDLGPSAMKSDGPFKSSKPFCRINHNCQTGKWLTILKAQWTQNADVYPHFTIGNMQHSLDIFSCKGDLLARLADKHKITAVQAVTCSHPSILERAASGNASGRCVLWAPANE